MKKEKCNVEDNVIWLGKEAIEKEPNELSWVEFVELKEELDYAEGVLSMGDGMLVRNHAIPSLLKGFSMTAEEDDFATVVRFAPAFMSERPEELIGEGPVKKMVLIAGMGNLAFVNLDRVPREYMTEEWLKMTGLDEVLGGEEHE